MVKTGRNVAVALAAIGALIGSPRTSAAADAEDLTNTMRTSSHVRSVSAAIESLIAQAMEGSATFRRLVEDIDASDSYVYVNEGHCGHGVRACFVTVSSSGARRFMWVKVDTHYYTTDADLMGSIGHELRHTLEAISEPSVRTDTARFFLYERIGSHATSAPETQAATDAGATVRREVLKFNREPKSD
jgi:hypothetical protein